MQRFRKASPWLTTLLIGVALWGMARLGLELRDWLDSHTWEVTRSTGVLVEPGGGVIYGYEVEGWPHTGQRTHFFLTVSYLDDRPRRWLDANRNAIAVAVFYDPDAPGRAVLVPRVGATAWVGLGTMALAPLLALGGLLWGWRRRLSRRSGSAGY